jgi:hypothetical protein
MALPRWCRHRQELAQIGGEIAHLLAGFQPAVSWSSWQRMSTPGSSAALSRSGTS